MLAVTGCTPPIRQYDLKDQALTCEQANRYAHDTLKAMGYTITAFKPAIPTARGTVRGEISAGHRISAATVVIACGATGPTIDASEDGKLLGQLEFKQGFHASFTAIATQRAAAAAAAEEQAALPLSQRKQQGLEVLVIPMGGLDALLDFSVDLAAAQVLAVRIVVNNRTTRRYEIDAADIVLMRGEDGARVAPLPIADVAQRVRRAPAPASADEQRPADPNTLTGQLRAKLFAAATIAPDSSVAGFLFYPAAPYARARVRVVETDSGEAEGFVIEF